MKQIYLTKMVNKIVSTILILLGLKKESIGLTTTSASKPLINFDSRNSFGLYSFKAALVFLFFMSIGANAQINYYSKASATSFSSTSSWGTSLDGTGAAPTSISSASNFIVANGAALTLDADASVRTLAITSGSLAVSANTLTVSLSSGNASNLTINNGGYLTVNTGGTINVNGYFLQNSGGVFTQNGGNINVDGNSGVMGVTMSGASSIGKTITVSSTAGLLVNSVVTVSSGTGVLPANTFVTSILSATQFTVNNTPTTSLVGATLYATNSVTSANNLVGFVASPSTLFLNGGTFTIVDPHANSSTAYALSGNANPAINASINHTFKFGNGVSTDAGFSTNGFYVYLFPGTSYLILGNVVVDNNVNLTNNRQVTTLSNIGILGNLTVNPGGEYRVSSTNYLAGNLINNGTLTTTSILTLGSYYNAVSQPATATQTISGSGFFRNSVTVPTANFTSLTFNNTSVNGVVFSGANSLLTPGNTGTVSGTLTFTNCPGGVDLGGGTYTQGVNIATPGTTSWTAGGFKNGTFKKWFGTATLPTALPSTTAGNFPFVVNGANRNFQVGSSIATLTSGGTISVTYTSASGLATVTGSDPSGPFSYDRLSNAYWAVSSGDGLATTGTYLVNGGMEGITNLTAITNEPRLVQSATAAAGTHVAATGTATAAVGNRSGLSLSSTATNFYIGINSANIAAAAATVYSVQNGNWNDATTWNTGVVPASTDTVTITVGTTVTVDNSVSTTACNSLAIVINGTLNVTDNILNTNSTIALSGITMGNFGILNQSGGSVVVGATGANRNYSLVTGAAATSQLNVSGGTLTVNGNINIQSPAIFSQSGGTIKVDGNSGVASVSMTAGSGSGTTITVANTAGLVLNSPVSVTAGTGAFAAGTYVTSIVSATQFTVNVAPTTALAGATVFATSNVVSGTALINISSVNTYLTGGTMIIVDPHANTVSASKSNNRAFAYNLLSTFVNASTNHTLQFGDGTSTDAGGSVLGFVLDCSQQTGSNLSLGNLVINGGSGINRLTSTGSKLIVLGNITINANSEFNQNTYQVNVNGNLTNNGSLTATSTGILAFQNTINNSSSPSSNAQTLSGTGTFRNGAVSVTTTVANSTATITVANTFVAGMVIAVQNGAGAFPAGTTVVSATATAFVASAAPTTALPIGSVIVGSNANFNSIIVNNNNPSGVTFSGTTWNSIANATVSGTLTFTNGFLDVSSSSNGLTLGVSGAPGTLAYTAGGFKSGSTFRRWVATTVIAIPAVAGQFPFLNNNFQARHAYFGSATALATAGWVAVKLNEVAGTTTQTISELYNLNSRSNSNWVVTTGGSLAVAAANDAQVRFRGDGIFALSTPSNFLAVGASAAALGTSAIGTGSISAPEANKTGLSTANVAQTFYVGTQNTIQSTVTGGAWSDAATWMGGVVPTCSDVVLISNGATVSVTSETANNAGLTVNYGGTLSISGGALTVGCTNNNATFINNGTLTVSGGAVNVNGNMQISDNSNFTHSAGTITIDGNNGGTLGNTNSVASGTPLFAIGTAATSYGTTGGTSVVLSGGTIVIKDPHVGSATATSAYAVYAKSAVNINAATAHTFQFGDGTSTDAGATGGTGFVFDGFAGAGRLNFGSVTVNSGTAATRVVTQTTNTNAINGNLTITSGTFTQGTLTTNIGGNIAVNGSTSIFLATGTTVFTNTTGTTTAAQTSAQSVSVSASGQINNLAATPTANFTNININNSSSTGVTFGALNNLSGAAGFTGASLTGVITFNGNATTTGSNALLWGTSIARGTGNFNFTSGGMTSGSTFAIGTTTGQTGTTIVAGTANGFTTGTGGYPFVDNYGNSRSMWIQRTGTVLNTGIIGVKYTDVAGVTSGLSYADGAYTVTDQMNGYWSTNLYGTTPYGAATTFTIAASATNAFGGTPLNANARLMNSNAFVGTYQAGTTLPNAQRISLTSGQLTASPFYMGLAAADVPFVSVTNGNWETASTWNKNAVPTATDNVIIGSGTAVTVNSTASAANAITVNKTATLSVSGSTLTATTTVTNSGTINVSGGTFTSTTALTNNTASTITVSDAGTLAVLTTVANSGTINATGGNFNVTGGSATGITNNAGASFIVAGGSVRQGPVGGGNTLFTNSGILTVSSGVLNVNGSLTHSGTAFNQSGGAINLDPNAAGNTTNSTASTNYTLNLTSASTGALNWTGGTLTIIDPPATASAAHYSVYYAMNALSDIAPGHTLQFGDGISSDVGGVGNGFLVYNKVGTYYANWNDIVVNGAGNGTTANSSNRIVKQVTNVNLTYGNLTINYGGELDTTLGIYIGGNVLVNNGGVLTAVGTINLAKPVGNGLFAPATNAQTIGGVGTFRNLPTSQTANLTSLLVNNINPAGVTLNIPLSLSGTLTMTNGIINTTATNLLTLGTTTAGGTLTITPSATAPSATTMIVGPFARTFAASRTATGTYDTTTLYPVGKGSAYTPVYVDPTTAASGAATISGEAFATNSGTGTSDVTNLSAARWEVLTTSGFANITNSNVRVSQSGIASNQALVQAPTASGAYDRLIGTSTYAPIPALTGSGITASTLTASGYFAYGNVAPPTAPVITSFSTAYSPFAPIYLCSNGGSVLTITGTSLGSVTSVVFNSSTGMNLLGTITNRTSTSVTVTVPAGVIDGFIRVTNPTGTTDSVATYTTALPPVVGVSAPATICSGTSTVLSGTGGNTYTWSPSTGLATTTGDTVTATPATTTTYTVTGISTAGCKATSTVLVTVNPTPTAITIAPPAAFCSGGVTALNATGGAYSTTKFADSFNAISTSFDAATVSGTTTTSATVNNTLFAEGTGSILFNTTGVSSVATYSLNSNLNLAGANSAQLTFSHIASMEGPSTSYDYGYVEYSSDGGTTWVTFPDTNYVGAASTAVFTGGANRFSTKSYPDWISTITSAAATLTNSLWKTETFTVPAAALTSQFRVRFRYTTDSSTNYLGWLIDNVNISSVSSQVVWSPTTNLYSNAAATTAYTGVSASTVYTKLTAATTYTATSTNGSCSSTSSVTVTPNPLPTIAATGTTNCGTTGSAITATGGVSYVWSPALGLNGTTGASVTASPAVTSTYTVTGTDANGCVNTGTALVTVNNPVTITTLGQPSNTVVLEGQAATFTVTATGTGLTYQWQVNDTTGQWADIAGATAASYTTAPTTTSQNAYQYRCIVSGTAPCSPVTSNAGNLTVSTVSIVTQPAPQTICSNNTATFTVVTGGEVLSYQWEYSTNGTTWTPLTSADATTATITLSGLTAANSLTQYHCVFNAGQITSNAALLTVSNAIAITSQPTNQSVCNGAASVAFTAAATGTGLTYQWQMSTNGTSWTNVSGATATTYTINNPTIALNGRQYKVIVSGVSPCAAVTSDVATLTVTGVTVSASAPTICLGAPVTLSAVYTGTPGTTTSSWVCATANSGATTAISGDSASVTPNAAGTYVYTFATNGTCSFTPTVSVTVNPLPIVTAVTASPASICSGDSVSLAATSISNGPTTTPTYAAPPAVTYPTSDEDFAGIVIKQGTTTILSNTSANNSLVGTIGTATGTAGSYSDFTSFGPYSLTAANAYTFTVSSSTSATAYSNALAIYIDYNRNGIFTDAGEQVYTSAATTSGAHSENGSFTVPANVSAGYTRMRVISNENLISSPTQAVYYGEYEEYTINLLGNVSSTYAWSWNTTPAVTAATGTTTITNTSGAAVTRTFTATATIAATGCTNSLTTSAVNINTTIPTPVATNSVQCGSQTPTCSVTGTGTTGNKFKWYTVATGGTALTGQIASTLVSYPVAATTTFYVSEVSADGLCESPRVAVTVTSNTPYPFTLSATTANNCSSFASLTPVTIATNGNASGSYTSYSWNNATTVSGNATTGWTFSPTTTTTYTLTATDGLCSATANVVVTPTALPNVTIAANPANICVGASTTLTALSLGYGPTTAPTYTAPPAVTYATSDEDFAGIVIKQGTTTILSNTSANNSLVGTIGTATGTAGSYSDFTSFGPYALTAGQAYTFTATSSTSGTAYSNALAIYIDYNRNGVFTDAGEQVYTSAATTSGAHSENGSFTVPAGVSAGYTRMRVISNEGLISSPDQAVYYGEYEEYTINLLGNAPSTYACTWNDPAATTGNTLTVTPATTTAYTVSAYSAATGCTGTATSTITVYPFPTAPSVTNAPQCGTRVPTIAVADTNGYTLPTFKWYADATTTTALQTSTSTTYTTSVSATTTFYVSVVSPGGCESPRAAVTTTVIAPAVLTVSPAVTICTGGSTTLTASGAVSYTWTPALGLNGTTGSSVIASPSATTTYSVTGVDSNSCTTAAATVTVTVAPYPAAVTITQGAASVCENAVMSLTATGGAIGSQAAVGPASPTAEGGSISATAYGIGTYYQTFDVLAPTSLASVDVFPTAAIGSTASISIADSTGTILNTVPYTTTVTNGDMQTVALNIPLAVGTGYRIGQGGTAITLNRNYSNAVYPYTCALANITGNNFATNYFYYFYNMKFSTFVPTTFTWSPSTNLYSDAAGTVAYTGANSSVVYTKPSGAITYTATAANGACTTSATTTVTPIAKPQFTLTDATICKGLSTTLTATGAGLTYSWSPATGLSSTSGGSVIANPLVTTTYTVLAIDPATGCTDAKDVTVTVINPGAILSAGTTTTQTVVPGQSTTFTVATATGATYTYQWQVNTGAGWVNLSNAGNYSGATTATLTVSNIDPSVDGYQFQCLVTGASPCSTLTPVVATLNVSNTGFASQPSDVTLCNGGSAAFSITTSGDDPFSVQWQMSTDNGVTFADITNGTNANGLTFANTDQLTLNVSGITLANSGVKFTCIVNSYITSNPATITVKAPVVITTQPANQSVCVGGGVATFTAAATGADLAYQWQYSTNGTTWSNYTGTDATTASISIVNPALAANGTQYHVIVSGNAACSSVTSTSATLNINNPTITTAPVAATVIRGNTATFTVAASAATSYQWQRSATLTGTYEDVVDGTPVGNTYMNASLASLSVVTSGATVLGGGNYYRCVVNNNGCNVTSTGALLTVTDYCNAIPSNTADEEIYNVTVNGNSTDSNYATVNACTNVAPGAGSILNRYSNFTSLGALTSVTRLQNVPFSIDENECDGATYYSNGAAIWVDFNQDGDFLDAGEKVYVENSTTISPRTIAGSFAVPLDAALGNTRMRIIVAEGYSGASLTPCLAYSYGETEDYLITILPAPACDAAPNAGIASALSTSICTGKTATLALTGSTSGVTGLAYQWYYSANGTTFAPVSGATTTSLVTGNLTANAYYYCTVTCTNSNLSANSNTVTITVADPQLTGTTPGARCGTGTVVLGASSNAGATVNWYAALNGGSPIGTGTSFTTPSITATTTYYAEASAGGTSQVSNNGAPSFTTSTINTGLVLDVTIASVLTSVDVYSTSAGTVTMKLVNSAGTLVAGPTSGTVIAGTITTPQTINLGWTMPVGTGYKILVTSQTGALGYSSGSFPSPLGNGVGSIVNGATSTGTTTLNYFLYNLRTSSACQSGRTAVVATVEPTPTATISYAGSPFCNNAPVGSVTLTGTNAYTGGTFTSTTGLGLNGTTGAIDPTTSTPGTYVVTYTTNATTNCTPQTATTTVVINESVLTSDFTYASASYCNNSGIVTPTITGTPGVFTVSPATGLTVNATTGAINFATATPGTYTVSNTVTACGNNSVTTATITVYPAVVITTQPTSSTVCAGTNASITVVATGTNVAYQWQMSTNGTSWSNVTDGGVYSGATTATLALTGVTASMTGYQFIALVSDANPCVGLTSSVATLTVSQTATPVITPNPANVCAGGVTALTVNTGAYLASNFNVLPSNFTASGTGVSATLNTTYYSEGTGSLLLNAGISADVTYSLNSNINFDI